MSIRSLLPAPYPGGVHVRITAGEAHVAVPREVWRDADWTTLTMREQWTFMAGLVAACDLGFTDYIPQVGLDEVWSRDGLRPRDVASLVGKDVWALHPFGFEVREWFGFGYTVNREAAGLARRRAYIPDAVRHAVYARDGWRCVSCGASKPLSLDHIHPWSLGGPDTEENLQTLCRPCNSRKGARLDAVGQPRRPVP